MAANDSGKRNPKRSAMWLLIGFIGLMVAYWLGLVDWWGPALYAVLMGGGLLIVFLYYGTKSTRDNRTPKSVKDNYKKMPKEPGS